MLVQCIADTHGDYIKLNNNVDGYFLLGDIQGNLFYNLCDKLNQGQKFAYGVLGNHDDVNIPKWYPWVDFKEKQITILSNNMTLLQISGIPIIGRNDKYFGYTQSESLKFLELGYADIVICHSNPYLINDKDDEYHKGYIGLLNYIDKFNPKYVFHGHTHQQKYTKYKNTNIYSIYKEQIVEL